MDSPLIDSLTQIMNSIQCLQKSDTGDVCGVTYTCANCMTIHELRGVILDARAMTESLNEAHPIVDEAASYLSDEHILPNMASLELARQLADLGMKMRACLQKEMAS